MSIEEIYKIFQSHPNISTDSRKITPNSLFFALKGENFNGNTFSEKAINNGAAYSIIDDSNYKSSENIILVDNVLKTLQKLAAFHRNTLKIPVIGITGTNGKTTTKELINSVLSKKYKTLATIGNFNNHIGVPLTILSITKDHEIAIIEMGANHIGEIGELCDISKPDFGIITNIGKAHLEGFGGIDGVIETKRDLYKSIQKINGRIFVNIDNDLLIGLSNNIDKITYGKTQNSYCYGKVVKVNPFVEIKYSCEDIEDVLQTQLIGSYNFENILAAITVGIYFGVSKTKLKDAVESYQPGNSRSQVMKTVKNTIILDSYNANPTSMEAAIRNFSEIKTDNKVLIIGDMLELGEYSQTEHSKILEMIEEFNFQNVIIVGKEFLSVCENDTWNCFNDSEDAKEWLIKNPVINAFILLKASRGIKLEKLIDTL
jgi:UDP-N-acetylmuramoyl-tripeptide--D-alanyl-D-alanine ligase